jgi:hypothetical protein
MIINVFRIKVHAGRVVGENLVRQVKLRPETISEMRALDDVSLEDFMTDLAVEYGGNRIEVL